MIDLILKKGVWQALLDPNIRGVLSLIGAAFSSVVVALWKAYKWCDRNPGAKHCKYYTICAGCILLAIIVSVVTIQLNIEAQKENNKNVAITAIGDAQLVLMWGVLREAECMTWEEAHHFARSSTSQGYSDWQLPTVAELKTFIKTLRENPVEKFQKGFYWTDIPQQACNPYSLETRPETNRDKWLVLLVRKNQPE